LNCNDILGGSFGRHDGFINPLAVMRGFTDGALRRGARLELGTEALRITADGGRVTAVETDRGRIDCENVVICTGARAAELASGAGVELPVEPQRRQIVWARSGEPLPVGLPMVIDIGTGFHFRPAREFTGAAEGSRDFSANDILFACPDPNEAPSVSTKFDESFCENVYERARHRSPFLFGCSIIREKCRAGLYENSPDHHAILGASGVDGLYLANGFSGHGVMHSPATGRALSEIILDDGASFLDVSCLGLDRFTTGKLLHETAFI